MTKEIVIAEGIMQHSNNYWYVGENDIEMILDKTANIFFKNEGKNIRLKLEILDEK